jgi:hypothetical protein
MDLGRANFAVEAAGMLGGIPLACRGIGKPAVGTAEIFGGPQTRHVATMQCTEGIFQSGSIPGSMIYYPCNLPDEYPIAIF